MATTSEKPARKPNAAFMKPLTPSAELAQVIGSDPLPRTEVTKKIWEYIKNTICRIQQTVATLMPTQNCGPFSVKIRSACSK